MWSESCCYLRAIAMLSTCQDCANNMLRFPLPTYVIDMRSACYQYTIDVQWPIYDRAIIDVLSECYRYAINPTPLGRLDSISIIIINNMRSIVSDSCAIKHRSICYNYATNYNVCALNMPSICYKPNVRCDSNATNMLSMHCRHRVIVLWIYFWRSISTLSMYNCQRWIPATHAMKMLSACYRCDIDALWTCYDPRRVLSISHSILVRNWQTIDAFRALSFGYC